MVTDNWGMPAWALNFNSQGFPSLLHSHFADPCNSLGKTEGAQN